ncbi:MAG: hypothetical protein KDE48_17530 [Anaerolineales bacterium]|nr:hypothetical protein [Anaerolineales bacterium]
MKHVTIALIVAQPGPLRNSLQTLLTTFPDIEIVAEARTPATLMRLGDTLQPDLVLIEADEKNATAVALQQIKREWLHSKCVVLVDTQRQMATAVAAGADLTLFKGCRATELIDKIEALLVRDNVNFSE